MPKRLILALVAVAALTIVPALIEGHYVNRWGTPPDLAGAAERVGSFPREFGAWTYVEDGDELPTEVCRELAIEGYMTRVYKNRTNGTKVTVLLMVGQSGPLLRHPPNVCYANMANEQIGDMTKLKVSTTTPPGEFNLLEYKKARTITNERFLVAYSLATDAIWKVPDMPRIAFGAAPMLYKVQLHTSLERSQSREVGAALLKQFADDFSAAFQTHVHAADQGPSEKPAT
jgi:Protein of unknown function (DUF3485)